ncbi:hypothetical protein [Dactylosporangium sp. CA-139066]|uniref:hypothetical protein n=1 Tax=Dactylosporangium sp. CA-139066 TaxID=3239930 RepID=UPI003D904FB9
MSGIRRFAGEHNLGRYLRPGMPLVTVSIVALLLVFALLAGLGVLATSTRNPEAYAGTPVPAALRQPIATAALSCPTLTPARLAGQLMAASRFDQNATSADGGTGVAGLTDAAWAKWAPDPHSVRADAASAVLALAHQMCDLVGAVRGTKVTGDPWRTALAAYRVGVDAVVQAHGVPPAATTYVDQVSGYADWYAKQQTPTTAGSGAGPARPIPAAYLPLVQAAGKVCPTVTPSRLAGQLMAASGFQADLIGPTGAMGIAQFRPDIWAQYAPSGSASPGDPKAAIPAVGTAMCDLVAQLTPLGGDPYQVALAAFWLGQQPVRQAGKVPDSTGIGDFVKTALDYAHAYATDAALSAGQLAAPTDPSSGPGRDSSQPTTAPPATGRPGTPPAQGTVVTVQATRVLERGQSIQSNRTRLVMENNGELTVYDETGRKRWNSPTTGRGYKMVFQDDGNLVVNDQSDTSIWTSNTPGHNGATLVLEADGNVCVVYQGAVIWAANTAH